jgi:hypothetical protein
MLSLKKNPDLPFVISDKEMAANPPPKKEKLTPVGFRCNDEAYKGLAYRHSHMLKVYIPGPRDTYFN